MAHRENNFEKENIYDRRKDSKFNISDLVEVKAKESGRHILLFVVYDKRQREDKQGKYWVYDVFEPETLNVREDMYMQSNVFDYIKVG